ncbi:MAG: PD40 domain-containing protein, partial [Acidobacteriaceae bacterium]|nr:PD40 domain-containing protein [Acidobacteriaceae bacterium]
MPLLQKYRFGAFEFDPQKEELRKRGVKLRLNPQAACVLNALLENAGEVVSREELRKRLWPSDTFVDFEHRLHAAISEVRDALGDSATNPRYIKTLSRRGYRFIAELELVPRPAMPSNPPAQAAHDSAATPVMDAPRPHLRSLRRLWLAAAVVVTLTFGVVIVFLVRRGPPTPAIHSAVPLTTYMGAQHCPSFAPDGERVAFSWNGEREDNFDIYVKQIGVETPIRLTRDPRPDLSPAWSPDGRMIAFYRVTSNRTAEVLLIPALGGAERRIAEVAAAWQDYLTSRLLAWSADGKWLAMPEGAAADSVSGLILLSVETGQKRRLTFPPASYDDLDPAFSPDMKRLAFVRRFSSAADIYVVELTPELQAAGEPTRLTSESWPADSPVWAHDGKALLFTRY